AGSSVTLREMSRPGSSVRLLLAALLLGAPFPARADDAGAPVPSPKTDPRKADPLKPAEQIKNACDAEAVSVRLLDPAVPRKEGDPAPGPSANRDKEAQKIANSVGAGIESEADGAGQTLSWKRGRTSKSACREKFRRVRKLYGDRVTFEPTTEERVAEVRRRRDALIPEKLRKNPGGADAAGELFDGGGIFGKAFDPKAGDPVAAAPSASPFGSIRPARYAAGRQLPMQYRGALAASPPRPVSYSPPTFTRRAWESVTGAYEATTAYVSQGLDEAGQWVSGVARSVRNRFYSGIEMISGFGYTFVHAGRQTNWGTKPLVDGLRRIAAYMRGTGKAETDLAVGDISSANGGRLGGHASHQTGRDVDIGFYMTDAASGKAADTLNFVRFTGGRDGLTGRSGGRAVRFDAERNWMLVQAILANPDPAFKPTHIFIANHLKAAVLAAGANSPDRGRAAALMSYWPGHDNHLHLRVR
ncbi:MAG: penicillin-insensitive murein endopeptidase, partial [Elusimicrobia bacterium]|nr:penicillin-insensitive murein endopeptidase [Elusimicrobiota bacterium]